MLIQTASTKFLNHSGRKIHYPPETTTILLIVKLVAMYKQTDKKEELFNAIQNFHHEFINENLMIAHKMLGENHQTDLNKLFTLFSNSFDFTDIEMVIIYQHKQSMNATF